MHDIWNRSTWLEYMEYGSCQIQVEVVRCTAPETQVK